MVGRLGDLWEWTVLNHQHSSKQTVGNLEWKNRCSKRTGGNLDLKGRFSKQAVGNLDGLDTGVWGSNGLHKCQQLEGGMGSQKTLLKTGNGKLGFQT